MPLGLQWVDFVAGFITLEMLLAWVKGALLLVLSVAALVFGVHPTVSATTRRPPWPSHLDSTPRSSGPERASSLMLRHARIVA